MSTQDVLSPATIRAGLESHRAAIEMPWEDFFMEDQYQDQHDDVLRNYLLQPSPATFVERDFSGNRILVATRDLGSRHLGAVILYEQPALVFKSDDPASILSEFHSIPNESKAAILDMQPLPDTLPTMTEAWMQLRESRRTGEDSVLIYSLVGIVKRNGRANADSLHHTTAFLLYGSHVRHSCLPNTLYCPMSTAADAPVQFRVIRQMEQGEPIAVSDAGNLLCEPTHRRRDELLKTKGFVCKCVRCTGPDCARLFRCPKLRCRNGILSVTDKNGGFSSWSCDKCVVGWVPKRWPSWVAKESELEKKVTTVKKRVAETLSGVDPSELGIDSMEVVSLMKQASEFLGSLHYLVLALLELQSVLCVHELGVMELLSLGDNDSTFFQEEKATLRRKAVDAALFYVMRSECVAANCTDWMCPHLLETNVAHEPAPENVDAACFLWNALKRSPSGFVKSSLAARVVRRYLPLMRIVKGPSDATVREMEEAFIVHQVEKGKGLPSILSKPLRKRRIAPSCRPTSGQRPRR